MALPAFDPYYQQKDFLRRVKQQQLSGMPPVSEYDWAAYAYGQRAAKSAEQIARERLSREIELQNQQLGLQAQRNALLNKQFKSQQAGQTMAGIATMANVADKLYPGGLKSLGSALASGVKQAVPGLFGGLKWTGGPWGEATGAQVDIPAEIPWGEAAGAMVDIPSIEPWELDVTGFEVPSGCFITSATVDTLGLKDDGFEMNTLRWFRDNVLSKMPDGEQKIKEYYRIAPVIVKNIEKMKENGIYNELWSKYIYPSVEAILRKQYMTALQLYEGMVNRLRRRYFNG